MVTSATVQSLLSVATLEGHFAMLLEAAGWRRSDGATEANLAWSTWEIPGRSGWVGWLTVTGVPSGDLRFLRLEARSLAARRGR